MQNIKWQGCIMLGPQRRKQRQHAGAITATTNGSREGAATGTQPHSRRIQHVQAIQKRICLQHAVEGGYKQNTIGGD